MDLLKAISSRYSCRAYQDRPVEADKGASPKRLNLNEIVCYEKWGF